MADLNITVLIRSITLQVNGLTLNASGVGFEHERSVPAGGSKESRCIHIYDARAAEEFTRQVNYRIYAFPLSLNREQ